MNALLRKISGLFRRKKLDADMAEEMRAHLERRTQANLAAGMSADEARYAAQRQFGGVDQLKEVAREQRGWFWLEELSRDVRFGLRQLAKSPGFTAVSVVTLALGIGLNTSMFSLMNLLLLQPLPYPDSDRLVRIFRTTPQTQTSDHSLLDYLDLKQGADEFAQLAAFRQWGFTLAQDGRPALNLNALRVSAEFFPVIGLQPELGRFFNQDEDRVGNHVIVLSYGTWQAQFGGDPAVIGRTVRIDGEPTTIVGVTPAAFTSVFLWGPGEAFRPLATTDAEKANRRDIAVSVIGRSRPGLSLEQIDARLTAVSARLASQRAAENRADGLRAVTLQSILHSPATQQITFLMLGLAGFVLLIACANLANLQLSRAVVRTRELAIRAALGASRARLIRPLLTESLLLSLIGGACGLLVAFWSNSWLSSRMSANGFVIFKLTLDWPVMSFAAVVSVLTGLVFGVVPAWIASRVRVNENLKSGARGSTGDRAQHRFRHGLIVVQFALALVLLAGAGLFIRGLDRLLSRDQGWNTSHLLQGILNLPPTKYANAEQTNAFYTRLQERLGGLSGVEHVSVSWTLPMFQFLATRNYAVEGREAPPAGHEPLAAVNGITPSYLDALKIRLVAGRNFSSADTVGSTPVALINESMARALFPQENPIGRRIGGLDPAKREWMEIVGVIADQRFVSNIAAPATRYQLMRPLAQETWNYVQLAVRASAPDALVDPVRRLITEMDPDLPVQQLGSAEGLIARDTSALGTVNAILVSFALLGLFLAALGLYGVIARLVVQRTPEIGVRVALGAQSRDIVWLVLGSGIRLTLLGTALGLIGAYGVGRALTTILPEMVSLDIPTVVAVALLLVVVALLACWLPARRASKVDPMTALRAE